MPRVLGAAPGRGQERPLQVQAGDHALIGQAGQQGGAGFELGERRGDQAGQQARAAVRAVKRSSGPGVVGGPLGERATAAAVNVQVDEAGEHPPPVQVDDGEPRRDLLAPVAGTDRGDQVAGHQDPAGVQHAPWRHHPAVGQQQRATGSVAGYGGRLH